MGIAAGFTCMGRPPPALLVPRLDTFKSAHPDIAIEVETNPRGVGPDRRDFDAWLAYIGETASPRPVTRREDTLLEETLYEEQLLPVCSPALLAARERSARRRPGRLRQPGTELVGVGEDGRLPAGMDEEHSATGGDAPRARVRDQACHRLPRVHRVEE